MHSIPQTPLRCCLAATTTDAAMECAPAATATILPVLHHLSAFLRNSWRRPLLQWWAASGIIVLAAPTAMSITPDNGVAAGVGRSTFPTICSEMAS